MSEFARSSRSRLLSSGRLLHNWIQLKPVALMVSLTGFLRNAQSFLHIPSLNLTIYLLHRLPECKREPLNCLTSRCRILVIGLCLIEVKILSDELKCLSISLAILLYSCCRCTGRTLFQLNPLSHKDEINAEIRAEEMKQTGCNVIDAELGTCCLANNILGGMTVGCCGNTRKSSIRFQISPNSPESSLGEPVSISFIMTDNAGEFVNY